MSLPSSPVKMDIPQTNIIPTMSFILSLLAVQARAHMIMANPTPYGYQTIDNSPLTSSNYPCKVTSDPTTFYSQSGIDNTYAAGSVQTLSFKGSAVHGGGSCQLAITNDMQPSVDTDWRVILSIESGCPTTDGTSASTYNWTVPEDLAAGQYSFAWTWISKLAGQPEYYMNCAPITVTASDASTKRAAASDDYPELFVANLDSVNSCKTSPGTDVVYPDPGPNVEKLLSGATPSFATISQEGCVPKSQSQGSSSLPTATAGSSGGSSSDSTGSSSGSSSAVTTAATSAATTSSSAALSGGVFFTTATTQDASTATTLLTTTGTAAASAGEASATTSSALSVYVSPIVQSSSSTQTTATSSNSSSSAGGFATSPAATTGTSSSSSASEATATTATSTANTAETTKTSSASSAASSTASSSSSASASATATGSAGGNSTSSTGGAASSKSGTCSDEGTFNCVGTQYQQCASGAWTEMRSLPSGTTCQQGTSATLWARGVGGARSRTNVNLLRRVRRGGVGAGVGAT